MEAAYRSPAGPFKLPRRGHFFAAQSAKKRRNLTPNIPTMSPFMGNFGYSCRVVHIIYSWVRRFYRNISRLDG
jgi:hypothetical protein